MTVTKLKEKLEELEKQGYGDQIIFDYENEDFVLKDIRIEKVDLELTSFSTLNINTIVFDVDTGGDY